MTYKAKNAKEVAELAYKAEKNTLYSEVDTASAQILILWHDIDLKRMKKLERDLASAQKEIKALQARYDELWKEAKEEDLAQDYLTTKEKSDKLDV